MGIDVSLYRARIGAFQPRYKEPSNKNIGLHCGGNRLFTALQCVCAYLLIVIDTLLLISGIESNPGPEQKDIWRMASKYGFYSGTIVYDVIQLSLQEQYEIRAITTLFIHVTLFLIHICLLDLEKTFRDCVLKSAVIVYDVILLFVPAHNEVGTITTFILHLSLFYVNFNFLPKNQSKNRQKSNGADMEMKTPTREIGAAAASYNPPISDNDNTVSIKADQIADNLHFDSNEDGAISSLSNMDDSMSVSYNGCVAVVNTMHPTFNVSFGNVKGTVQIGPQNQVNHISTGEENQETSCSTSKEHVSLQDRIDRTRDEIHHFSNISCIHRGGLDAVIQSLRSSKMAIICGICGEGKTTIAIEVMKNVMDGKVPGLFKGIPIKINRPDEWKIAINLGQQLLLFIDDIFGSTSLNKSLLRHWEQLLNDIGPDIDKGRILLIVSSRKHILKEALKLLKRSAYSLVKTTLFSEKNTIDLSGDYKLSGDEKRDFITKMIQIQTNFDISICGNVGDENMNVCINSKTIYISEQTVETIAHLDTSLGFPYLCKVFFSNKWILSKGIDFFVNANDYITEQIDELWCCDKMSYFVLVYTLLNNEESSLYIDSSKLDPFTMSQEDKTWIKNLSLACGLHKDQIQRIKDTAESLNGVFLKFVAISNSYTFSHHSVLETVSLHFGKKYPDTVLKQCSYNFLDRFITIENKEETFGENLKIKISKSSFETLAERMYEFLMTTDDPETVIDNNIMQDVAFLRYFFNWMDRINRMKNVISKVYPCYGRFSCKHQRHIYGHSIAVYAQGNFAFLSQLIKRDILQVNWSITGSSEGHFCSCYMINALRHGNLDSVKLLIENGFTFPENSLYLASSGNDCLFHYVYENKLWTGSEMDSALDRSCSIGNTDIMKYLYEKGAEFSRDSLCLAVDSGNPEAVELVFRNIKASENVLRNSIFKACINQNLAVLKFFAEHGEPYIPNPLKIFNILEVATSYSSGNFNIDILKYLLENEDWSMEQKTKTLNEICRSGSTRALEFLLLQGTSCNNDTLLAATKSGFISIIQSIFDRYKWPRNILRKAMNKACKKGYLEIVRYFKKKKIPLDDESLDLSIRSGNEKLFQFVLSECEWSEHQLNNAMIEACKRCSLKFVKYLKSKGASLSQDVFKFVSPNTDLFIYILSCTPWNDQELSFAMETACEYSHLEVVKFLRLERNVPYNEKCLGKAALSLDFDKVDYLYATGKWSQISLTEAFEEACVKGNLKIIKFLKDVGDIKSSKCLVLAVESGVIDVFKLVFTSFSWSKEKAEEAMDTACSVGYLDIVQYLHTRGVGFGMDGLCKAVSSGYELVDYIFTKGVWSKYQLKQAMKEAEKRGNFSVSMYLQRKLLQQLDHK